MPMRPSSTRKRPKVSVVVPIYGVEKYLAQCVNSIIAQTLEDMEIILVDDGSKDKCPEMVDAYAGKDSRIVAVHQENGGYGRAVNRGIELATGEYVGIVEPDDWIEPTMYEEMYNNAKAHDPDMVKCSFYRYDSTLAPEIQSLPWGGRHGSLCIERAPKGVFTIKEYPNLLLFHASVWATLYQSEFIKGQKFIESPSASYQDFPFMVEALCRAKRISVVRKCLLHYRMEQGQYCSTKARDKKAILMAVQCMVGKKILKKHRLYDLLKEEFYFHAYLANIGRYNGIHFINKKEYFMALRELFLELREDSAFQYTYFDFFQKKFIKNVISNRFYATALPWKSIRQYLLCVRLRRRYFFMQILGVQLSIGVCDLTRPALLKIPLFCGSGLPDRVWRDNG